MKDILWLYEIVLAAMAVFALFIGLRGLIRNRPLIFSARWLFAFMALAFAPQFGNSLSFGFGHSSGFGAHSFMMVVAPATFLFLVVVFWFQLRGYIVFGVTDSTFRGALHHALSERGLRYEEQLGSIIVPAEGLALQVAIQSWMGTAQMKAKRAGDVGRLTDLSSGMKRYFASNSVKVPKLVFILYVVIGAFLSGAAATLATL